MAEAPGSNPGRSIKLEYRIESEKMRIGIISDTHDNVYAVLEIIEKLKEIKPDLLIHLGDIISPATADMFKDFKTVFIRGNNDGDINQLEGIAMKNKQLFVNEFETNIDGKKLLAMHGHRSAWLQEMIKSGRYRYVLYGHTHQVRMEKINNTIVLNPGGHYYMSQGGIILLDTSNDKYDYIPISGGEKIESNNI